MKKVLVVISGLNKGGTESFLFEYYKHLINENFKVDILSFSDNDPEVVARFNTIGISVINGIRPIFNSFFKFKKQLKKILLLGNYDIIHCNCNFDNAFYLYFACKQNVPVRIGHYHDTLTNVHFGIKQRISNSIKRHYCKKYATKSFGCSKEALSDMLGTNDGIVIENIIDAKELNIVDNEYLKKLISEFNLSNYKYIFGNISRFEEKKNQKFIVETFYDFNKENPNSILILGGTGDSSLIKQLVHEKEIDDKVLFIGPRSDVKYWYKIFTLYLMPSLFEGFGISAVEAQCASCYVLASQFLPKTTDFGNIKYLKLNKDEWIKEMKIKHSIKKILSSNDDKISFFLNELTNK